MTCYSTSESTNGTLPEIDKFIRQNQLDFLGFHLPGSVLQNFRERFPTARTMTNLALWHDFEMENPSTFAGMYQFWVRKVAPCRS